MSNKVVILGGGVAGLSAAHELIERGYEVEVLEKLTLAGGKARSIPVLEGIGDHGSKDSHADAVRAAVAADPLGRRRPWLPGEHGFRFFPNFYRHITDTLARIPTETGTVADCLVDTTQVLIASYDKPGIELPSRFPENAFDLANALRSFLWAISPRNDIPYEEVEHFAGCIWRILTSCEERRLNDYEKLRWWDFVGAEDRSEAYQKLLAIGLTRSLVAAKAREASVKTIGDIFLQLVFGIIAPGTAPDRLLNGPTSDVWIKPWLAYLTGRGMTYRYGTEVTELKVSGGRISSVTATQDGRPITVSGDWFISALPIERMAPLVSPAITAVDPSLATLPVLARNVQWMNGIQFYLKRDIPITHGHIIFIDSPWALTAVSQRQFWTGVDFGQWGDGTTRGILSVDISQWDHKGFCGKPASRCTRTEIMTEVWAQLKRSLNVDGQEVLRDEDLHYWFLDPDIVNDPNHPDRLSNVEPLLVNNADTWRLRPEAGTAIANLALASDYVRTYTDLATMEGANEAARRAVNAILERSGSTAKKCKIWNLHEPDALVPFREYDRARYKAGLPWDDRYPVMLEAAMTLAHKASGIARGGDGPLALSEPFLDAMSRPDGPLADPGVAQALSAIGLPSGVFENFGRSLPGLGSAVPGAEVVSNAADALVALGVGDQGLPMPTANRQRRRFRFTQKA
ncbi:FAD-dependent oxidoreductase [Tabrizicola sp. J26]|uniref:hydroxysqualene dehydroxylase n=1 Tax=Alitabrizicola rongguiensis TaxID=2909234 RepID=UPI001F36A4B0|nr:FAD-dependent oxidoreductase [Tabrizicola rongguiensis]MCF1709281.1 FAD-dependent oxidoreductase [Tabrizicola rongguiensis]